MIPFGCEAPSDPIAERKERGVDKKRRIECNQVPLPFYSKSVWWRWNRTQWKFLDRHSAKYLTRLWKCTFPALCSLSRRPFSPARSFQPLFDRAVNVADSLQDTRPLLQLVAIKLIRLSVARRLLHWLRSLGPVQLQLYDYIARGFLCKCASGV